MIAIEITFPWGRYHAHPWGLNSVRLREAEWPPSPWRLLRALASSWFRAHPGSPLDGEAVALIECLGRALPQIGMVKVAFGHTVHYQPNYNKGKDRANARYGSARHESHFVAVHGPVVFCWRDVALSSEQEVLLDLLLAGLSYFGRSESLCRAQLVTPEVLAASGELGWCVPQDGRRISAQCRDVFCPDPSSFQAHDLWRRRAGEAVTDGLDAPTHLVDQLLASDMKPDGAGWRSYLMPADWPQKRVVRVASTAKQRPTPTNQSPRVARYLRFSLQCRVPIPMKFTVPLAEQFRRAAHKRFCDQFGDGQSSFALFGHPADRPTDAVGEHQNAFFLPTGARNGGERNPPGMIADLHVWCPYGLTKEEAQILFGIQRLSWRDGRYPVRPLLTAMAMAPPPGSPIATGEVKSQTWRSDTPFVPPRHFYRGDRARAKMREADSPERQLAECLRLAGIQVSGEIRRLALSGLGLEPLGLLPPSPYWEVVRAPNALETGLADAVSSPTHSNGSAGALARYLQRIGFFFEIRFDHEVALPMPSLGHSNHFGLGVFVPAPAS